MGSTLSRILDEEREYKEKIINEYKESQKSKVKKLEEKIEELAKELENLKKYEE